MSGSSGGYNTLASNGSLGGGSMAGSSLSGLNAMGVEGEHGAMG